MTWFDIMKLQPNRTRTVPGSYKSSHKTNWLDKDVWSDFIDTIIEFIDDKQDIAVAIKNGRTLRTKPDITEHPIEAMGRYFGGPNSFRGYGHLKREVTKEHKKGEALRQRLTNIQLNQDKMEDYMNTLVNKYLSTNGTTDEFTSYRRSAQIFGMMASAVGAKQAYSGQPPSSRLPKFSINAKGKNRQRNTFNYMKSRDARCGVMSEMNYALKLLNSAPNQNKPKKGGDFENLVEHITQQDNDYCETAMRQLVDRVFNFNKMEHCPVLDWSGRSGTTMSHSWLKKYYNRDHNLHPIRELVKKKVNPDDYLKMFVETHPKSLTRDSPLYKNMWGYGHHRRMYDFNKRCIKPFRTRLLLIYNFHRACTGESTIEEFKEWVN